MPNSSHGQKPEAEERDMNIPKTLILEVGPNWNTGPDPSELSGSLDLELDLNFLTQISP